MTLSAPARLVLAFATAVIIGLLATMSTAGTMAYWSDTVTVEAEVGSGVVRIGPGEDMDLPLRFKNLVPGTEAQTADLTIENSSTTPVKVYLWVDSDIAAVGNAPWCGLPGQLLQFRVQGEAERAFCSLVAGQAGAAPVLLLDELAPGVGFTKTLELRLPPEAGNEYADNTTTTTFRVYATQLDAGSPTIAP